MATSKKSVTEDAPPDEPTVEVTDGDGVDVPVLVRDLSVTNANVSEFGGDEAALTGHFCTVVGGDYAGRYGVLTEIASADDNGVPLTAVVRTRDDLAESLVCDYSDLRPAEAGLR